MIYKIKTFQKKLPIEIKQLPKIDAILIPHDHHDHLDYESIQLLKEKTAHFFVPLGVGKHLESWGINSKRHTRIEFVGQNKI